MLVAQVIMGILGESVVWERELFLRGLDSTSKEEALCHRLNSSYRGEPRRERNHSQAMIDQTAAQTPAKCC